eukprot:scaffold32948_cov131-Isochrysis_galbana.AAC.3
MTRSPPSPSPRSFASGRRRRCSRAHPAAPRPASAAAAFRHSGCPRVPDFHSHPTRTPARPPPAQAHDSTQLRRSSPEGHAAPRRAWARAGPACRRGRDAHSSHPPTRRAPRPRRWQKPMVRHKHAARALPQTPRRRSARALRDGTICPI